MKGQCGRALKELQHLGPGQLLWEPSSLDMTLGKEHLPLSLEEPESWANTSKTAEGPVALVRTAGLHCPGSPFAVALNPCPTTVRQEEV